jgi:signal transduction histidine kinase
MSPVELVLVLGWLGAAGAGAALILVVREQRRRRELVARACHEIRGPLTAAALALHAGAWGAAEGELRRAGRAVDDLWTARDGTGPGATPDLVDLAAVLEDQLAAWRAMALPLGRLVILMPGRTAWVTGDADRLVQVVSNLVANALEHGAGAVRIALRTQGSRVRVEVADEGPGLPAPVAALAAMPEAGVGARGRGLAISAQIAARHRGRLAAAPTARGARIVLDLPAATSAAAARADRVPGPAAP